jgi:hypothetical protein
MTRFSAGFHPDFDALSAHADRSDTEAARTKVGRHVASCDACRAVVEEIRALGAAARTSDVPGAPAGLWARIEQRVDQGASTEAESMEREVPVAGTNDALVPGGQGRNRVNAVVRRAMLGVFAVLAVVAVVLVLDSREPLAAATPRRLTTDRDAASPGTTISFHYRPIAALAGQPALTLWLVGSDREVVRYDRPLMRAGTLRRVSALDYTGTATMPDSVVLASYIVGDSTGQVLDRTELRGGYMAAMVLAADQGGRPRLDAFVAALARARSAPGRDARTHLATRMRELYPNAPETWILAEAQAPRGVVGDIVKLFESRERKYYSWHDRLEHRTGLSENTELMMSTIGWELMDTARADFWTNRLIQDHPTSASAPSLWLNRYRDVPKDSAAIVLRAFEPIYNRASFVEGNALERASALAQLSGDSILIRRWHLRVDPSDRTWLLGGDISGLAGDHAAIVELGRRMKSALAEAEAAERAGPTLLGRAQQFAWYEKQLLRTRLAALRLVDDDAVGARAALDTIVHEDEVRPGCSFPETLRWRAEASRQLGHMQDAEADLAYVVVTGDWRRQMVGDSVATLLGKSYSKASWDQALVDANTRKQKCWADSRAERQRAGG